MICKRNNHLSIDNWKAYLLCYKLANYPRVQAKKSLLYKNGLQACMGNVLALPVFAVTMKLSKPAR